MMHPIPTEPEESEQKWEHHVTFKVDRQDYLEKLKSIDYDELKKAIFGHPFSVGKIVCQLREHNLIIEPDFSNYKGIRFNVIHEQENDI